MRVIGVLLILFGVVLCLTIVGIGFGIILILVGGVLVAVGGRKKVVIHNVVTVSNILPEARAYQPEYQPQRREPVVETALAQIPPTPSLAAPTETYDKKKWQTLVRYDDDLRLAAAKVKVFGVAWEDELAEDYLKINDKTYLPKIVERILADATKPS